MNFIRAELSIIRHTGVLYLRIPKKILHCVAKTLEHVQYDKRLASNRIRQKQKPLIQNTFYSNDIYADSVYQNVDPMFNYNVRNSLHVDSADPLIHRINGCASVDQIFNLLNEEFQHLTAKHVSQIVLVLWDLQKIYNESYLNNLINDDIEHSPEFMLTNYLDKMRLHKDFRKVLNLLDVLYMDLSLSETACCLLYLKKMGVSKEENIMELLQHRCNGAVEDMEAGRSPPLSLIDLTRITATIDPKDNFVSLSMSCNVMPTALKYLDECKTADDFRLLTFLFFNIQLLIVDPVLIRYKTRLKYLISNGTLGKHNYTLLLQIADFLTFSKWERKMIDEVNEICEIVAPEIPNMDVSSLVTLHKVFQTNLQPAHIMKALNEGIMKHLTTMLNDDKLGTCLKLPHALFCYATYSPPEKRQVIEKIVIECMEKMFPSTIKPILNTLRHIKTPNPQINHKFWNKIVDYLTRDNTEGHVLIQFALRYIFFGPVGQIQRNYYFEKFMLDSLLKKFDNSIMAQIPKQFTKICAFILAFGYSGNSIHINDMTQVIQQLELMKGQLDPLDCLVLSRGIQLSNITMAKHHTSPVVAQLYHRADVVITERTQTLSENKDMHVDDLSCLLKTHANKRTSLNSGIIDDLLQKYRSMNLREQLDSLAIRQMSHSLLLCNVIVPSVFEDIVWYVVHANKKLLGDTVYKVLNLFYKVGYEVKSQEMFDVVCDVLERDKNVLTAYSLLHSCCALAYYQQLPESLVKYVFSIHFMEKLDAEVATCYQQWAYPRRVRRELMRLNRCVCVEYPQHGVPWFNRQYVQDQITNMRLTKTHLERSVVETARGVWPDALLRSPQFSPYGYKLDLFLTLDEHNQVRTPHSGDVKEKVAILLLDKKDFCKVLDEEGSQGVKTALNGANKHKRRHLEMLGYRLVEVSSSLWHAMHMTERGAREHFLRRSVLGSERNII